MARGELEQIHFLLGHASLRTTEHCYYTSPSLSNTAILLRCVNKAFPPSWSSAITKSALLKLQLRSYREPTSVSETAAGLRPEESRTAKRLHGPTSALGVIVPTALGQLGTLSLPHWAGSSTLAFGPGCCGFIGPVPSATLDKCGFVAATGEFLAD